MDLKQLEKDWDSIPQNITKAFKDHNYDLFLEEYKKFKPQNNSIYFFKGVALKEKGKFREAIDYFDKFIEDYPLFYFAYKDKGECHINLEEYKLAREAYKEALSYNQKDEESWCYSAVCFYLENKKEVAIGILDYALTVAKTTALISLLKGMMYEKEDMDNEALMSYIASQISSLDNEQRDIAGEKMFNLLKK